MSRKPLRKRVLDVGAAILAPLEQQIARRSLVGDTPFIDLELPWMTTLERDWKLIRTELDMVLQARDHLPNFQDISPDQQSLTTDEGWKTYFFYGYGFKAEQNCRSCPHTDRLLQQIPGLKTAFFSILAPRKHIPAHAGPYKGVLRYHLGLKIPEPMEDCRIRVGDEIRHWEEGKGMLFDDRYEHEVWNETDGERVVLFCDVLRPLPAPISLVNRAALGAIAHSPLVQDAKRNHREWEQRTRAAAGNGGGPSG